MQSKNKFIGTFIVFLVCAFAVYFSFYVENSLQAFNLDYTYQFFRIVRLKILAVWVIRLTIFGLFAYYLVKTFYIKK